MSRAVVRGGLNGPFPLPADVLEGGQVLAPRLRPGDRLRTAEGAVYELVEKTGPIKKFKRLDSGAVVSLGNAELTEKMGRGELRLVAPAWLNTARARNWHKSFEARPETVKRRARMRVAYVEAMLENRRLGYPVKVGDVINRVHRERMGDPAILASGEERPSQAALYEWMKVWEKDGPRSIKRLAFAEDERGPRGVQLHESVAPFVKEAMRQLYFTPRRIRVGKVWDRVVADCSATGIVQLRIPSCRTIRRLIKQMPPYVVARERMGQRAADHVFRSVGQMTEAATPGEVYEVDAHKLDVFAIENGSRFPLGRVWVTIVIDRCTRCIVGIHVHVEPPSSLTIAAALRNAFAPKSYMLDRWPEIGRSWIMWGLPVMLVLDNGLENRARFLEEALAELGVVWCYAATRTPEEKPYVERVLGTMARDLSSSMPGWTGASVKEKGDLDPGATACMTLADIDELMHRWVVAYNIRFHQGIRAVPEERWMALSDGEVDAFEDVFALDALLGDFAERTLSRKGVVLAGLRYGDRGNHRPLEMLLACRGHGGTLKVRVRFDRTDLSFVCVQDPDTREYIRIPSLDPEYTTGMTLARHRAIRAEAVATAQGYLTIGELCRARDAIQRRIEEIAGDGRAGMTERQFAAIWAGLGSKGSWAHFSRGLETEYGADKDPHSVLEFLDGEEAEPIEPPPLLAVTVATEHPAAAVTVGLAEQARELGMTVTGVELPMDKPDAPELIGPSMAANPDATDDSLEAEMAALGMKLK